MSLGTFINGQWYPWEQVEVDPETGEHRVKEMLAPAGEVEDADAGSEAAAGETSPAAALAIDDAEPSDEGSVDPPAGEVEDAEAFGDIHTPKVVRRPTTPKYLGRE